MWDELERRWPDFDALPADATAPLAGTLEGRRLLVTGATGFVGGWVLAALGWLRDRHGTMLAVTGVSRVAPPPGPSWHSALVGDVRDLASPPPSDLVLHAAMSTEAAPADGLEALDGIARAGARWALDAVVPGGGLLVLSSGAAATSDDAYARAKRAAEAVALDGTGRDRRVVIARLFTCIGPGYRRHPHLAHVALLEAAARRAPLVLESDGSAVRSYLYGADLAVWLLRLLTDAPGGTVEDVGSDRSMTQAELARVIADAAGGLPVQVGSRPPAADRAVYVPARSPFSVRRGLGAWTPLETAVRRTLALWPTAAR